MQFPLITAHTGCMNTPRNSIRSVKAGIAFGADIIEDDIRVTRDGIPVLAHDDMLHTVEEGKTYPISRHRYDELSGLEFKAHGEGGELVPLCKLEDMLKLLQGSGKIANLDIKSAESIDASAQLAARYRMEDQVILSGCQKDWALLAQRTHPQLKKLLNADADLFRTMDYNDAVDTTIEDARAASCFGINIDHRLVRPGFIEYAASRGLPVAVWTVQEEERMKTFIQAGAYSITTMNVSVLAELKRS